MQCAMFLLHPTWIEIETDSELFFNTLQNTFDGETLLAHNEVIKNTTVLSRF